MSEKRVPRLAILMHHGSHNHLHAMVSLAATCVSQGGDAQILLTHAALRAWLEDDLTMLGVQTGDPLYDAFYKEAMEQERIPDIRVLFEEARARGQIRLFGCQASVVLWRRYRSEQLQSLDAVIGHTTFLQIALDRQLLVI